MTGRSTTFDSYSETEDNRLSKLEPAFSACQRSGRSIQGGDQSLRHQVWRLVTLDDRLDDFRR